MHPIPPATSSVPSRRARRLGVGVVVAALALALCAAGPALAEPKGSAHRKLGRGMANVTLGVLALPGEVVQTTRKSGPFVGATWGLTKGVAMVVVTTVVGVWDVLTCPFQTPPDYKPLIQPEFPWGHFQEQPERPAPRRALPRKR